MIFIIIWWVVLFMVLPFGTTIEETPPRGFATSAPQNPHLGKKFLVTTLISGVIWGLIEWIMVSHWVIPIFDDFPGF